MHFQCTPLVALFFRWLFVLGARVLRVIRTTFYISNRTFHTGFVEREMIYQCSSSPSDGPSILTRERSGKNSRSFKPTDTFGDFNAESGDSER
jgi:hypothetical protein